MLATLRQLARLLRVRDDQVEEVVRDEACARAALSRRGLFVGVGALAVGRAFSLGRRAASFRIGRGYGNPSLGWPLR